MAQTTTTEGVKRVQYQPLDSHPYGVEIISAGDLVCRAEESHFTLPQQIDFFVIIAIASGEVVHTIDFAPYRAKRADWLIVKPGQVQQFELSSSWDGFIIPIRAEFMEPASSVASSSEDLGLLTELWKMPTLMHLPEEQSDACLATAKQMGQDVYLAGTFGLVESLLRQQLRALVSRLAIAHLKEPQVVESPAVATLLFTRFNNAVNDHYRQMHHVHEYASLLGFSERTLSRACKAIANRSAKEIVDQRITLEAKRMLTHTIMHANRIALELGFDDASHFIKFFKRTTTMSPGEFRRTIVSKT